MADVTRYEPQRGMTSRDFFDRFFERALGHGSPLGDIDEGMLPVDISETEQELIVRASLPGFSPDEVDVQVHQGLLSIKAEHQQEESSDNERFHRRERTWRSMTRRIALPGVVHDAEVSAEEVSADMNNGILTLHIPIPEQSKPKRIEIKGA